MARQINLFKINDILKYNNKKVIVLKVWWDELDSYRYEIRYIIGKNPAGAFNLIVKEDKLSAY